MFLFFKDSTDLSIAASKLDSTSDANQSSTNENQAYNQALTNDKTDKAKAVVNSRQDLQLLTNENLPNSESNEKSRYRSQSLVTNEIKQRIQTVYRYNFCN